MRSKPTGWAGTQHSPNGSSLLSGSNVVGHATIDGSAYPCTSRIQILMTLTAPVTFGQTHRVRARNGNIRAFAWQVRINTGMLGMDEWIWQYPELHPDQLRVVKRLNQTEEIYSPQVVVKD